MELVTPGIGLFFWMLVSFSIVLFVLRKYAWNPILGTLKKREQSIKDALGSAEKARQEMEQLKADNEKIMDQARQERDKLIKEAREVKDKIIGEAKKQASAEADKMIQAARQSIENEKANALNQIKSDIATLSVEIAEKIIEHELDDDEDQHKLIDALLGNVNLN